MLRLCTFQLCAAAGLAYTWPSFGLAAAMQPRAPPVVAATHVLSAPALGGGGGTGVIDGGHGGGGGGGGGSGDDDDASEFLRLLNSAEQASVLQDWTARARIYRMTEDPELKATHTNHLGELERLVEFDMAETGSNGKRMLLGLFQDDEVRALAAAEVSHANGLVVSSLNVYPAELNDPASTASLRMVHALHLLADAIETSLDLSPLQEEGRASTTWLAPLVTEADEE